ncbi:hypothetical protein BRYFOR_05293 [Marvinbryantia formatexigens DSM 14469]|uniref:Uncharacterized protein n=1 Tax=Marvinbryantia formatexigens DSM 14469 TaxID=478749 RepID=C6L9K3_9FIRM|nr:hypothetical protein BRYFOR_05293 [Marvinbryantia formatexigens DSM 14469]
MQSTPDFSFFWQNDYNKNNKRRAAGGARRQRCRKHNVTF